MKKFAEIAVNVPGVVEKFDYHIPSHLLGKLTPGFLVEVPFGSQKVQGIIIRLKAQSSITDIKNIITIFNEEPVVTANYIQLAEELAEAYFHPLSAYLMAMLPPGLGQKADVVYELKLPDDTDFSAITKLQKRLVNTLLNRGMLRGRQLDRAFRHLDWRKSMRILVKKGWVNTQQVLPPPKITRKQINTLTLHPSVDSNSIGEIVTGKEGSHASIRRRKVVELLAREKKPIDVSYIYASTNATSADIRYLEDKDIAVVNPRDVIRDPVKDMIPEGTLKPRLTQDQQDAWTTIKNALNETKTQPVLIRGITGSGKTELYIRAVEEVVNGGKNAIVLVPEIALTPQTIQRFLDRFPGSVGVVHSKLSSGERYDTWKRVRNGEISVLIGPRSALFTPMPNLGVIILDECHDDSYYQRETTPVYHAIEAALILGKISGALVIFGSATPNVDLYFRAKNYDWSIVHLDRRIATRWGNESNNDVHQFLPLPKVEIVDMREELQEGNSSIFSKALQDALQNTVLDKKQAILFLNRRGTATIIFCRDCGYTVNCPKCDFPLTFHRDKKQLICHTCGYSRQELTKCPNCNGNRINQYGMGTKRVEEELLSLIPSARVLRWDADTATGKQSESIILSHFKRHNADILIGTQMLAKGLDLPLVTLVGVMLADVGLSFPDFRTGERAFQLLTQVAGRAGRSQFGGNAILQTFQPDHYAIQHAATHDFDGFFDNELERRRSLQYPPFLDIIRLETRDFYQDKTEERATVLASQISKLIEESSNKTLQLIGPTPPYFARKSGYYRWQIILKGSNPEELVKKLKLEKWRIEVNPPDLL